MSEVINRVTGEEMYGFVKRIFPICRSLTGEGVRETLRLVKEQLPELELKEVPCGTAVYDWKVPAEWNCSEAYIEDESGKRIIDFRENNLHVVGYSVPMDEYLSLDELKEIVHTLPEQPEWIPYVTSYYRPRSGFCMSQKQLDLLKPGKYHAVIRSTLDEGGVLNYAEAYFPGETEEEILISTYICHPSMANNECSGPTVTAWLGKYLSRLERRHYSYRIIYIPETIGSITWLSQNYEQRQLKERVKAGFVINCAGDDRTYSYVKTRYGNTLTDRVLDAVLRSHTDSFQAYSYLERGSDERQFQSPLINLPVCSVCRSLFHKYPEYHTSADDLTLVTPSGLLGSYELMMKVISVLEKNRRYMAQIPCEPQMGKRGLYSTMSIKGSSNSSLDMMNVLAYCDGRNDLMQIAEITELDVMTVLQITDRLAAEGIIA